MSRHFCCCIPVRVAVFVTSILLLLSSALVAGGSIFVLIETKNKDDPKVGNLTNEQHVVLIVAAVLFSIIALSSLFGFIGSVIRKRSFVAIYSTMSFLIFLAQSAVDGWLLYELFRPNSSLHCQTNDNGDSGNCKDVIKDARIVFVVFMVIQWLLQLYICVVIKRYVTQLDEEQSYNRTAGYVDSAFTMGPTKAAYYPHQPLDQGQGLLAPKVDYPYTDPHHSHGSYGQGGV